MDIVDKLITDETFINWAFKSNEKDIEKWESWIIKHPNLKAQVDEAYGIVKGVSFKREESSIEQITEDWEALMARIERESFFRRIKHNKPTHNILKLTAVVAGLIIASTIMYFIIGFEKYKKFETDFNQKAIIELPDASEVTLNSKSKITYLKNWENSTDRKIWLEGEAFFNVKKELDSSGNQRKFIVYTDDFVITVIGTKFNVNTHLKDFIALESGSVVIENTQTKNDTSPLVLEPGQLAWAEKERLHIKEVNVFNYTSWRNNKIIFEDTPITEIVSLLKHNYGLTIELTSKEIASRKLTGELSVSNADDILNLLELSFNLKVTRYKNKVTLETY